MSRATRWIKLVIAILLTNVIAQANPCDLQLLKNPHPTIAISQFMQQMKDSGQLDRLLPIIQNRLAEVVPNPVLRESIFLQLTTTMKTGNYKQLDHWPILSVHEMGQMRTLLPKAKKSVAANSTAASIYSGDLNNILSGPAKTASQPVPVDPSVPQLTYGYFADTHLEASTVDQSIKLASILNSLTAQNGSIINVAQTSVTNPVQLLRALIESGHTVTMMDQRTYADFMSFNFNDTEIIWPLWIDTGVILKNGSPLIVPMGHSQIVYQIEGPLFHNASVSFFFGVDGVGFFANVSQRPNWTGLRSVATMRSDSNAKIITDSLQIATDYIARIKNESSSIASQYPAQGYGYLGVCNDSVATIDTAIGLPANTLPYPLLRAESLIGKTPVNDNLTPILVSLPKDVDAKAANKSEVIQRVMGMFPFEQPGEASALGNEFINLMNAAKSEAP